MITTKVHPKHRNPWVPDAKYPVTEEEFKIMRYEIKRMRQDLYKKQMRMEENEKYHGSANKRLQAFLKSPEAFTRGKSNSEVQDLWYKLYTLEASRSTSITGLQTREKMQVETMQAHGYEGIDKSNIHDFGLYMQYIRGEYGLEDFPSGELVDFFLEHHNLTLDEIEEDFDEWYKSKQDGLETTRGDDITTQTGKFAGNV